MATLVDSTAAALPSAPPSDPTVGFRRLSGAIALPIGFVLQLACNTIYAVISTESGLSDTGEAAEALTFYARYPDAFSAATLLAMLGVLAIVAGLPAALRVLRPTRPRLALWAVVLMVAGYVSYFGIVATNFSTLALALSTGGVPDARAVAVHDASASPLLLPFFLLFAVGGGLLEVAGLTVLAVVAIRTTNASWAARG